MDTISCILCKSIRSSHRPGSTATLKICRIHITDINDRSHQLIDSITEHDTKRRHIRIDLLINTSLHIIKQRSRRSHISQNQMRDTIHIHKKPALADTKLSTGKLTSTNWHRHIHLNHGITSHRTGNNLSIMDTRGKRHITTTYRNRSLTKSGIKLISAGNSIKRKRPRGITAELKPAHLHLIIRITRHDESNLLATHSLIIQQRLSNNLIITAIDRRKHHDSDITRTISN